MEFINDRNPGIGAGVGGDTFFFLWEDGDVIAAESDEPGGYQHEDAP